jgi:hypothetical protein
LSEVDLCAANTEEVTENIKVGNEISSLHVGLSILSFASISVATNYGSEVKYIDLHSKFRVILSFASTHTTSFLLGAAFPTHITRISSLTNFSPRDIHYLYKILSIFSLYLREVGTNC